MSPDAVNRVIFSKLLRLSVKNRKTFSRNDQQISKVTRKQPIVSTFAIFCYICVI